MRCLILLLLIGCNLKDGGNKALESEFPDIDHKANVLQQWELRPTYFDFSAENTDIIFKFQQLKGFGQKKFGFIIEVKNSKSGNHRCECDLTMSGNHVEGSIRIESCGGYSGEGIPDNGCDVFENDNYDIPYSRRASGNLNFCMSTNCYVLY